MRKIYLFSLIFSVAVSAYAQSSLDLRSRAALRSYKMEKSPSYNAYTKSLQIAPVAPTHVTAMIKLADGATAEQLQSEGVNVVRTRGNIAMVTMPVSDVERVANLKSIKKMSLSRKITPKMDKVRTAMGVDKIHTGDGLEQAYTGKGVLTGIVDTGMDPNHANFKSSDGSSRIDQLTHIYINSSSSNGYSVDMYKAADISAFSTDYVDTYHGTHTLGIMAGGYQDTLTYASGTTALTAKVSTGNNPFYGVAYDSDIAVSCGDMSDMLIALGIEGILDYAYNTEQPAVINLSLGSNLGARDGSEVMSQYLNLAGEEAIICIAAGNEGELPIAANKTFSADDTELKTFIYPVYGDVTASNGTFHQLKYGQTEIYSNDTTEFSIELVIYNKDRNTITFRHAITGNTNGSAAYFASEDYAQSGDLTNANFSKAFHGYVGIGTMNNVDTGRYYALIDCFVFNNQTYNADNKYLLGFIINGKPGQRIDCFCDATYTGFDDYDVDGWMTGSTNGSISDMACARNVLVVGSYNTRSSWISLDGRAYRPVGEVLSPGAISSFSSYGTLIDGRNLPHVCAPGATVISSTNTYYAESVDLPDAALQARLQRPDRNSYWHQEQGTSMATPAVAGAVALWLEADPTLTIDEVKEIAMATATKDSYVTGFTGDPVQWGAGKFNAYEGLKEVIRRVAGVGKVIDDNRNRLVVSSQDRQYEIFLGGADKMDVTVYNISGQPVIRSSQQGDEINIDLSSLNAGVYIVSVNGCHNQRIFVK